MKFGKKHRPKRRPAVRAVSGGTARLTKAGSTSRLAQDLKPALKTAPPGENGLGVLRPDANGWQVPEALIEASGTGRPGLRPGRFMLIVTVLSILFIAIITWFVSQMPDH